MHGIEIQHKSDFRNGVFILAQKLLGFGNFQADIMLDNRRSRMFFKNCLDVRFAERQFFGNGVEVDVVVKVIVEDLQNVFNDLYGGVDCEIFLQRFGLRWK